MLRRALLLITLVASLVSTAWGAPAPPVPRAVFVPLDDRPSTLLFVRQIARIGGGWLRVPPRPWLGRGLTPGQPEPIIAWLDGKVDRGCDTAILSADMVAYGGLVASRNAATPLDTALRRLDVFDRLRRPGLRVEVFTIIPRLALRTSNRQAPYEGRLAFWATKPGAPPPEGVPPDVVDEYLGVRRRNLAVIVDLIERTAAGRIDRLVIGQDDSAGTGLHSDDQRRIREAITQRGLENRITLLSGADEIGMDMTSGWLVRRYGWQPAISIDYDRPAAANEIPPLESLSLDHAVRAHVALAGATLRSDGRQVPVHLFIRTPLEKPYDLPPPSEGPAADALAERVRQSILCGRPTALADLALINMADPYLARAVIRRVPLPELEGYAAWNTPSNKLGTVIAQIVSHRLAERFGDTWGRDRVIDSERAHQAFLLARLVDDYRYQAIVRAKVRPSTAGLAANADPLLNLFGPAGLEIRLELLRYARRLFDRRFRGHRVWIPGLQQWAVLERTTEECVLPWLRLFEVEVRIDLRIAASKRPGPQPRPRNLGPEPTPTEGPPQESR